MKLASAGENLSSGFANYSAFVICFLVSIISEPATGEISIFWLVFEAEQAGFDSHFVGNPKTSFLALRPK